MVAVVMAEAGAGGWFDGRSGVGIFTRLDAGDGADEEVADGAEGIVIEGVHADILEAACWGPTVPAFPHGRRALFDGEEPRRIGVGENQPPREVGATDLRKDRAK